MVISIMMISQELRRWIEFEVQNIVGYFNAFITTGAHPFSELMTMPTTIIFVLGTPVDEMRDFGILANAQSTSPLGHTVLRTD